MELQLQMALLKKILMVEYVINIFKRRLLPSAYHKSLCTATNVVDLRNSVYSNFFLLKIVVQLVHFWTKINDAIEFDKHAIAIECVSSFAIRHLVFHTKVVLDNAYCSCYFQRLSNIS